MQRFALVALGLMIAACGGDEACDPTGGGPYWLAEGETVTVPLTCATELPDVTFTVAGLPAGATYDPSTSTIGWTPGLDQAVVVELAVTASTGEATTVKLGVADAWDDPANVPVVDPLAYPEEYGVPVMFVGPAPTDSVYQPVEVVYGRRAWIAEGKLRGATSLYYPKNSYTLKFPKADKFSAPERGLIERRKLTLISTFDDNSYVRQRLGYELWNELDPAHIQIEVHSAVVYLDGEYWGLYTVADHVDGYLMEDHGFAQDGNLYKAIDHDANFMTTDYLGAPKGTLHDGYEKKEGVPIDDFSDLETLVGFVATASDPRFRDEIGTRVRRDDYEDWWMFAVALLADDTAGKNTYHYHDPIAATPWRCAPWDLNHSFGQTYETFREAADTASDYRNMNRMFDRFLAEPTIGDPMRARYGQVLRGVWSPATVLAKLDAYAVELDASAHRDERKWGAAYRGYMYWNWRTDFTTYVEELAYLRTWITARWSYLSSRYP